MCDEWLNFEAFKNDMYPIYKPGLTIERVDVNGNYCKENCTWITRGEQVRNRRCSIWVDTEQGRMTVGQAAKIAGLSWPGMYMRVKGNWPKDKLLIPRNPNRKVKI